MKKQFVLCGLFFCLLAVESRAEYLTCFYTPGDVTIFAPYNGTSIIIKEIKPPNIFVWGRLTRWADQVLSVKLNEGYYILTTTEKVSLLVGDHISGPGTITRGYYALDQDGKGTGVNMFTHLRANSEAGEPILIVFSYKNNNKVKISQQDEISAYSTMWEGTIHEGGNYVYKSSNNQNLRITSDYPISVLVTGKSMQCSPADYSIPSSSGSFYGKEFYTFLPGGLLCLSAYNDETHIDLLNPQNSILKSWDLNQGDNIEQDIMQFSVWGNKFFKIVSNHHINAKRITKSQQTQGMDCLADRSGSLYGYEFIVHSTSPIEIFSFEDNTKVYIGQQGNKKMVTLSKWEHYNLSSNTGVISGEIVSDKAVLLQTSNRSGATFIKIPETLITNIPGPPSIFNVRHDPYKPTTNDGSVEISWVTSEVCSSVLHYRVQGQTWHELPDNTFRSVHFRKIPVSSFNANDIVEYYVTAMDYDSYLATENNTGMYYRFEVSPYIPILTLSRMSTTSPHAGCDSYKVNLLLKNEGSVKATNIKIKEELYGLLPSSDNCKVVPKSNYKYDVEISVPDLEPNQSGTIVSYQVFPLLYSNNYSYNIGTGMTTITYESPNGNKYSPTLSPPITVEHLDYNDVYKEIRKKDYLIVTNTLGLMAYLNPENAGRVLREAAAFALARNGVIACVEDSDPKKIEKLIDSDWNNRLSPMGWSGGWEYLLFLGGVEIVPTFECNYDWTFSGTRAKVADNIYADVMVDVNNFPELMVGRLPGDCANSLIYQMKKSLKPLLSEKALLISGTGDGQDDFVWVINKLSTSIRPYSNNKVIHWKDYTSIFRYDDNPFTRNAANNDLVIYRNHGSCNSWPGIVYNESISDVNFGTRYPMIWSIACETGDITQDCLGEAFLNGSLASVFIGASGVTTTTPNNDFALALGYYHNTWMGPSIGESFLRSKRKIILDHVQSYTIHYYKYVYRHVVNDYNLYGDPKRGLPVKNLTCFAMPEKPMNSTPQYPLFSSLSTIYRGPNINADQWDFLMPDQDPEGLHTESIGLYGFPQEYQEPPVNIKISVPKYEVQNIGGIDRVTIPNDNGPSSFSIDKEPIVPTYTQMVKIDKKYKIQSITLESRSEPEKSSGLFLPVADFSTDNLCFRKNSKKTMKTIPGKEQIFDWLVIEQPNGNQDLAITVYPFYYTKKSTDIKFYRDYSFVIDYVESFLAMEKILTIPDEIIPGRNLSVIANINNRSEGLIMADIKSRILNSRFEPVDETIAVKSISLNPDTTNVAFSWNSSSNKAGMYYYEMTIMQNGQIMDKELKSFLIGGFNADAQLLDINPDSNYGFKIGDTLHCSAIFYNGFPDSLFSTARIVVRNFSSSALVMDSACDTVIPPQKSLNVTADWITNNIPEGTYKVSAYLIYNGKASEPINNIISTKKEFEIKLNTLKETYSLGEKIVLWIKVNDLMSQAYNQNTMVTAELIKPDGSKEPLKLDFYPSGNVYSTSYYLFKTYPKGLYEFKISATEPTYILKEEVKTLTVY